MKMNNMIMVCGFGRNVGKTTLSLKLIKHFISLGKSVVSIKTSSHQHELTNTNDCIEQGEDFDLVEEKRHNTKDSSKMLQAGARRAFYIQGDPKHLPYCLEQILKHTTKSDIIVCESGGLRAYVEPAIFLYISGDGQSKNRHFIPLANRLLNWDGKGNHSGFTLDEIIITENSLSLQDQYSNL